MKTAACLIIVVIAGCGYNNNTIKIKGSDTEVNLAVQLAENFHTTDSRFSVSISGGGSGLGIASLLNGQADIANSSRELTATEDSLFKMRKISIDTFVFAEDAIAFVVPTSCSLDSISVTDLSKILDGTVNNWIGITGKNMPVNIYGRQSNSGTHSFLKKKLGIEFSERAKEMNGNAQIIEAVKRDESGIGYVGAGYLLPGNFATAHPVKVLKIFSPDNKLAISPLDEHAIENKQYYFQRPLYQFIRKSAADKVAAFIAFEKSSIGLEIIRKSGYYTLSEKTDYDITRKGNN